MKRIASLFKWFFVLVLLFVIGVYSYVELSWKKTYDAPLPDIKASTDSAIIAHGKHLVTGPAHCISCHVPMDKFREAERGVDMPLSGGWELNIPPGIYRAPNLTPDKETGIGNVSDAELARALRYSVNRNGGCMFPLMPFQELSDEDVTAVISYLRSQPAVKNKVPASSPSFMGKALLAFGLIKPEGPKQTPPKSIAIDSSIEYGAYLANRVANCNGCHTERDFKSGAFVGEPFAGGTKFIPDAFSEGYGFVTPNITPHPGTGVMASWSEEVFIKRMRGGKLHKGSPMPWVLYGKMSDMELKALYRYLQTLKPVEKTIAKVVYAPGEKMPDE